MRFRFQLYAAPRIASVAALLLAGQAALAGDFNGDGRDDELWSNLVYG